MSARRSILILPAFERVFSCPHKRKNDMANHDEAAIEAEIQAKGLTAPRITPADLDAQIVGENYFRASEAVAALGQPSTQALSCLTICVR